MKAAMALPLTAAVMAGGRSSRMGRDKAFLQWKGQRLIDRQVALLRSLAPDDIVVSGRAGIDYELVGVPVVCDDFQEAGPLAGLAALLRATTAPHILILAVDMPAMTSEMLGDIAGRRTAGCGVVPRIGGDWEPLAAVYPRELTWRVEARIRNGRYAMRGLIDEAVAGGEMAPYPVDRDRERHFYNWNRPGDRPD